MKYILIVVCLVYGNYVSAQQKLDSSKNSFKLNKFGILIGLKIIEDATNPYDYFPSLRDTSDRYYSFSGTVTPTLGCSYYKDFASRHNQFQLVGSLGFSYTNQKYKAEQGVIIRSGTAATIEIVERVANVKKMFFINHVHLKIFKDNLYFSPIFQANYFIGSTISGDVHVLRVLDFYTDEKKLKNHPRIIGLYGAGLGYKIYKDFDIQVYHLRSFNESFSPSIEARPWRNVQLGFSLNYRFGRFSHISEKKP